VSAHARNKSCQQRVQVKAGHELQKPRFRQTHHDGLPGPGLQVVIDGQFYRSPFQQSTENACTTAVAGIAGGATDPAAQSDRQLIAAGGHHNSLLFDH
jgi:hypothetical protein